MFHDATRFITGLIFLILIMLAPAQPAQATSLPTGYTESLVVQGISSPTTMTFAPDGRLFVAKQNGNLLVVKNGQILPTPFLSVSVDSSGERGLLGIAFDPDFAANQYVYIYYTTSSNPKRNRVSRFIANGDVAVPGSELILLELDTLSGATNHNGGAMNFGADGKLYIAVGENALPSNSQTLNNLLGKILRMNPDGTIPTDNPFYDEAAGLNRLIWALGVRNPFTFDIDPVTDQLFINDVGAGSWEEINNGVAGGNYGWPTTEGATGNPDFISPVHTYPHSDPGVCALTGGVFYRSPVIHFPPELSGDYFFADYCADWIKRYDIDTGIVHDFASNLEGSIVDLDIAPDGRLYYLARSGGKVMSINYNDSLPSISQNPADLTVLPGEPAEFSCMASSVTPETVQWTRDNVDIPGATGDTYILANPQLVDDGAEFRCVATNPFGAVTSLPATLTVTPNQAPTAIISAPAAGSFYDAGQTINYAGSGADAEDGAIPAADMTWQVDFHHGTHSHPFIGAFSGTAGGSFDLDALGHPEIDVWYRIYLTVMDSGGRAHTTHHDIYPNLVWLDLDSNVDGSVANLNGAPQVLPVSFLSVVGIAHELEAPSPQSVDGLDYVFESWSDGEAALHTITAPDTDTTYTVNWVIDSPPEIPILTDPDDAAVITDSTPTFRWAAADRADEYELVVDDEADFSSPSVQVITDDDDYTSDFLTPGVYHWRVRSLAASVDPSDWSATRSLTINSPSNAEPQPNYFTTATPTLTWGNVTWAVNYEIQVDDATSFSSPVFSAIVPTQEITTDPLPVGVYHWRVRALRGDGSSGDWSNRDQFTIDLP